MAVAAVTAAAPAQAAIRLPGGKPKPPRVRPEPEWPDTYFDDRTAAVWLRTLAQSIVDPGTVVAMLNANRNWLIDANGRCDDDDDDTDLERTWTRALFECAATCAKTWTDSERNRLVFDVLDQFSDEAFIDTAAAFLVKSDLNHIDGDAADTQYLVDLRARLWARLSATTPWKRHCRSPRGGLGTLNELILAFFCKVAGAFGDHTSYTKGLKDEQIVPFLPVLTEIVVASAPCPSIAILFLDVLDLIDPQKAEPFLLSAATSWSSRGDQRFWSELGIGQRVCALVGRAAIQSPAQQWIEIADVIAATGVVAGETLKQALRARP